MSNETKAVRKTLTIPKWLNDLAEENKLAFSKILQKALMDQLGIHSYEEYCRWKENQDSSELGEYDRLKAENAALREEIQKLRLEMSYMSQPNTIGDKHDMGC